MKIAIIGCGHMGSSMAKQLCHAHSIAAYDKYPEKITLHRDFPQIQICKDPQEAISHAELILLFIKPHDLESAAKHLKPHLNAHHTIVSGLAGTPVARLKSVFGEKQTVVRMMPNLAVAYGQGVVGCAEDPAMDSALKDKISTAFATLGLVLWLPEEKMDALTAMAGSGPAFVLIFLEAMIDAGIAMGFSQADAQAIALQTLSGTHALMQNTRKHPGELRWQVSSPAGTTIAGTCALEEANVRAGVIKTFLAAYHKAKNMHHLS